MSKYYYTIGEVGNLLELKTHVIRYWETVFPQLKPNKKQGHNRRYTQDDIQLLRTIKEMLYIQKYTIEGAKKVLSSHRKAQKSEQPEFNYGDNPLTKRELIREKVENLKNLSERLNALLSKAIEEINHD